MREVLDKVSTDSVEFTFDAKATVIAPVLDVTEDGRVSLTIRGSFAACFSEAMQEKRPINAGGRRFRATQCAVNMRTGEHTFYMESWDD